MAGVGHNGMAKLGKGFVERIELLEDDLQKAQERFKDETATPIKNDIKNIYDEAKAEGLTKKAIKAVVTARKKERQAELARKKLDIADQDTFDNIRLALGDLADLPLGEHALGEAEVGASA